MKPEDIYKALYLNSVKLPPDPDPSSSRSPELRHGVGAIPTYYPNLKLRNMYILGAEADYLMINTYTGVVSEYEIKVTKSDLLKECRIARFAQQGDQSTLMKRDASKFQKHCDLHTNRQLPPNYYSFVVPEELLDTCKTSAPEYSGIYCAQIAEKSGRIFIVEIRTPKLVSSVKADAIFFARCAEHLFAQLSDVHLAVAQIKVTRADSRRKYLMDIARAISEAERLIAEAGRNDDATKRFLIERAISGLIQRDKDDVTRYYRSGEYLKPEES